MAKDKPSPAQLDLIRDIQAGKISREYHIFTVRSARAQGWIFNERIVISNESSKPGPTKLTEKAIEYLAQLDQS